ncbi:uncharacterized protein BO80DRAFT_425161 [Aspergillus ibericus CBS 121593]|uniref:Uncharacterized protein n=1 Tax=Aspergillus ibericus CBS 121593 TaxID=1448316 RepID=A0A395H1U3_9EURO|nr:hypothetical protein BO80DRAFT_425161 [Aspergillus ibericus CBS 121593]RAL01185.1 hypothetical protein BO80DRAFT_425161 [Aspergillus ibericus CBS 121593]
MEAVTLMGCIAPVRPEPEPSTVGTNARWAACLMGGWPRKSLGGIGLASRYSAVALQRVPEQQRLTYRWVRPSVILSHRRDLAVGNSSKASRCWASDPEDRGISSRTGDTMYVHDASYLVPGNHCPLPLSLFPSFVDYFGRDAMRRSGICDTRPGGIR